MEWCIWMEMTEVDEAPVMTITLYYKEEAAHNWSSVDNLQILAPVVTARYFKVRVNISDPTDEVFLYVENFALKLYQ